MTKAYYEIVRVTENEIREAIRQDMPITNTVRIIDGFPVYYCVTRAGTILTWPRFDPDKMQLFVYGGELP